MGPDDIRLLARNTADIEIAARGKRRHRSKEERRRIVEESLVPGETPHTPAAPQAGTIHIELGRARVYIEGAADPETIRAILEQRGR